MEKKGRFTALFENLWKALGLLIKVPVMRDRVKAKWIMTNVSFLNAHLDSSSRNR